MLAGIGENAGVVDIGQGYAVTFKVESHNHPSYVEPYQGAATGVGGIVRDILAMGARPVAVMDPLRFGPLDAADTRRVLPGIVAGVGGYGNCLGLPNIGGEAVFDATYLGNPLVNALCVGVLRHEDLHLAKASGAGNQVDPVRRPHRRRRHRRRLGAGLARPSTRDGPAKRPSVQVGDPFMEKLLIECTLELFAAGVVAGIQDLGGAGLSCATSELASAGDGGMHVELDRVPLRDSSLAPEEILMSESQERMMAVVEPDDVDAFLAICAKWDVEAIVVGEVTDTGRLHIDWHGERVVDVPPRSVAHDGPDLPAPLRPPRLAGRAAGRPRRGAGPARDRRRAARDAAAPGRLARTSATSPGSPTSTTATCAATPCSPSPPTPAWSASTTRPTSASRSPPTATAASPSSTPTPARSSRWPSPTATSPPAARRPLAVSDCLNFGSPEDPDVMWQFAEACRGLKDACLELGIPVTGGNVSLYNQTGETAILPTPVVAVLGVIEDVTRRTPTGFGAAGEQVFLLGETREELSGSEWAHVVHGHLGGLPPRVDLGRRAGAGRAAAGRVARRRGHQRPRPLRRRPGADAGRVDLRPGHRRLGLAGRGRRRRRLRGALRRVHRPRPGDGHRRPGRRPGRARRAATAYRSRRSGAPAATRSPSRASSTCRSPRRGRLAGHAAGGLRSLRSRLVCLVAIPGTRTLEPPPQASGWRLQLDTEVRPQLDRRIARTPTTSPSAATTAAPAIPCATTSAG